MKTAKILTALLICALFAVWVLGAVSLPGCSPDPVDNGNGNDNDNGDDNGNGNGALPDPDPDPGPEPYPDPIPRPQYVRGLYLSGRGAGSASLREPVLELIRNSELNAVVVDVKTDDGSVTYIDTEVELAIAAGSNRNDVDMRAFLETLKEDNIYPIARIVVFKDSRIGAHRPEWAFKDMDGEVWKRGSTIWIDPRNREYWDYILDLSIEAALMGFREIQYDYVRWPDGLAHQVPVQDIPPYNLTKDGPFERSEVIAEFLAYMAEGLKPYNVEISADIYGLIGRVDHELTVGQQLELLLASGLDIICPMMYPGHYADNTYFSGPQNRNPYQVIYSGTREYLDRMEQAQSAVILRPWLQDFNDRDFNYGVKQIHAQLQALKDQGVKEYLFWNAGNKYTAEAYKTFSSDD